MQIVSHSLDGLIPHILAPTQFFPNRVEECDILQLHQPYGKIIFPYGQLMVRVDELETRIEGADKILPPPFHFKRNDRIVGDDDGAHVEIVRCDGRDDEIARTGEHYRPAAAERIACAARRRGDDDAVSPVGVEIIAVEVGVDGNHGGRVALEQGAVVECERHIAEQFGVAFEVQHYPLFDEVLPAFEFFNRLPDAFFLNRGEKTHAPQIDAQQWHTRIAHQRDGIEHGAVATHRYHTVNAMHFEIQIIIEGCVWPRKAHFFLYNLQIRRVDVSRDALCV